MSFEKFMVVGYEGNMVKVKKNNDDPTNDVGKILYIPQNQSFALVIKPEVVALNSPIFEDTLSEANVGLVQSYKLLETSKRCYICQWLFYKKGDYVNPGSAATLPEIGSFAFELTDTENTGFTAFPDFSGLIGIYAPMVVEHGLVDKHLDFLAGLPYQPEKFVYELVVQVLQYAIRQRNTRVISLVDNLLRYEHYYNLVMKYQESHPVESQVVTVEDGNIKAVHYDMPGVGNIGKVATKNGVIYGSVMDVSFSFDPIQLGERTLELLRRCLVIKNVTYKPMVYLPNGSANPEIAIREYPEYGTRVNAISEKDIQILYPGTGRLGHTGKYEIHFDVEKLCERSFGVFGKSGTGKSTLVQLLALEIIGKHKNGVALIFDEHTELAKTHKAAGGIIKRGLQDVFPDKVRTVAFGKATYNTPDGVQHQADTTIKIPLSEITEEDILSAKEELRLTKYAPVIISAVRRLLEKEWKGEYGSLVEALLFMKPDHKEELVKGSDVVENPVNEYGLNALQVKLKRVFLSKSDELKDTFTDKPEGEIKNSISTIVEWLKAGQSVIVNSPSDSSILVVNMIFRLVIDEWKEKKPRQLVIFLEEAHRLIPPDNETLVSVVAREMRKYGATLAIIDQTPKKIDSDTVKQIGTYFVFPLDYSEASCGVMPEGTPVSEVLSKLGQFGEAYVHGSAFLVPTFVKVWEYQEISKIIMEEHQKELGLEGLGTKKKNPLSSFYSTSKKAGL